MSQGRRLRIAYLGSGSFGVPTLAALAARHELAAVVTQPDRPAGRSRRPTPTPVAQWASAASPGTPVFKPERVNEPGVVEALRSINADAFVVIAFGQKLGTELLAGPMTINLHASKLPRWRGAAPINWAIMAGDSETGNSVITVTERMDAGAVLGQSTTPIGETETAGELHDRLSADGPQLMLDVLEQMLRGRLDHRPQRESDVTLARKLSRADAVVNWAQPARACARRINGLSPWPGVAVRLGGSQVKLVRAGIGAERFPQSERAGAGRFLDVSAGLVACGDKSSVQLLEAQPAGGTPMAWADFVRGRAIAQGAPLESVGADAC